MLASLDPHSQFMDPETYNDLKVETEGSFGGLGIEITIKDGMLTIITPIEDTPAWKAGIKAGDRIVKINDEPARDISLTDAVKKMRGKIGQAVKLSVLRESEKKILEFKITRDTIKIKDIKYAQILEDGIGYIRIVEFRKNTAQDLDAALANLSKQNMSALILDLRNNPGGLLDAAAKITGKFIEPGKLIIYTKSRQKSQDMKIEADAKNPILKLPLVILINEGSASGSEIVAACLQDYKRAIIIGTKSFGKGSVQTVIPLSDGSALRLTTSRYFTPSGKIIHARGVIPDILVEKTNLETAQTGEKAMLEEAEAKDSPKGPDAKKPDLKSDNQIISAVNTLKALRFYKQLDTK